ncbi:hypothetical protein [Providencia rettgeri]|uniref:hypothetical protein n=1 Tax=Providencia rettgeri TaxID=587 RepID=UPI00235E6E7E|nr:hypothetical protein [Providencia rettgeri]
MDVKHPTDEELKEFLLNKYLEEKTKFNLERSLEDLNKRANRSAKDYKEKLTKITPQLFFQFLTEKGFSAQCISCGAKELSVPESGFLDDDKIPANFEELNKAEQTEAIEQATTKYVSYIFLEKRSSDFFDLVGSYYKMHCLNCGHLSLYRSSTVLKWLESKEGKSE